MEIQEKIDLAWRIRKENFKDNIYFYAPTIKRYETEEFQNTGKPYFVPVSITGSFCALQCDHCKAKILKSMSSADTPEALFKIAKELKDRGIKGILISGGSDKRGVVPIIDFIEAIEKIKERLDLKILIHVGLVDKNLAKALSEIGIEAAMIDIIGDNFTIKEVYHLDAEVSDYERSLANLCEYKVAVAPHVVVGLHYGEIRGEENALRIISRYDISCLVLVGLMPQIGTPMEEVKPPDSLEMGEIFYKARIMFPSLPILLGCERTYGLEKMKIEEMAVRFGLNGIAYPSEGIVEFSKSLKLIPHFSMLCCALLFEDIEVNSHENEMAPP